MARSSSTKTPKSDPTVQEDTVTTATVVDTAAVEAVPAEVTPAGTEVVAETTPEVVVDISSFVSLVSAAQADKIDLSTGDFKDAADLAALVTAYAELPDAKHKAAARKFLDEDVKEHMNRGAEGFPVARATMLVRGELAAAKAPKAEGTPKAPKEPKAPVDPTEAYLERYLAARAAVGIISSEVPEGVAADWLDQAKARLEAAQPQVQVYRDYLAAPTTDAEGNPVEVASPEGVPAFLVSAFKIVNGRGIGKARKAAGTRSESGYSGPQRDVLKHIQEAFADQAVGSVLSVGEIRNFKSAEYGDNAPSQGAVSARIKSAKFPAADLGFEVVTDGKLSLKKIA